MKWLLYLLMLSASPASAYQTEDDPVPGAVPQIFSLHGGGSAVPLAGDADFIAAYDAFLADDAVKLAYFAQRLKNTPLEVYAAYYQLHLNLENADPQAVTAFLARPADTPVIDLLRAEWLKVLGKQQQWQAFDAEFPRLVNEDEELTCYRLQSRSRHRPQEAYREARTLWLDNGKTLPESCALLFDAARIAGAIQRQDILTRLRLALEANNVSLSIALAEYLEGSHPGLAAELRRAAADPARYLEKLSPVKLGEGTRIAILFALQRVAKQNSGLAATYWATLAKRFPEVEQRYFSGLLGYEAARNLEPRALEWYRAADSTKLNEQQRSWRVRAALRSQDWTEVLSGIEAMPPVQQREPSWRYWKARALQALGKQAEAKMLFARLSAEHHFYGQLAEEELAGEPVLSARQTVFKPSEHSISAIQAQPGIQRTIALYRVGLREEALEEWRWALRNFNDRELLAAAEIARRNGMYDRAIGAADKTVSLHDFSMRYLAPYRDALRTHIRENELDEAWVHGLMRQESRFSTSAKSMVGATGLMQIMPSTARWVANKLGLKDYRSNLLHQLDTNLRLGTYYLKTVLTQAGNSPVMASAAYNAGPLRALQWRGEQPLEGAIYAESIPFGETREYVKKVMSNTAYYAEQFGAAPRSLKQRLGDVAARTTDNSLPDPDVP